MNIDNDLTATRVIYIACDDRSGSTVTERCLAGIPGICSLGEVHNLPAYIHNDRSFFDPPYEMRCTCGELVRDCDFWSAVASYFGAPFDTLKLRVDFPRRAGLLDYLDRARWRLEELSKNSNGRWMTGALWHHLMGYNALACSYWRLYDAAAAVSGASIVVDSSKWPLRFNYLSRVRPQYLNLLLMYRNPYGVVFSKMRHTGVSPQVAAYRWLNFSQQMELFSQRLPEKQVLRVFYGQFCRSPEATLNRMLERFDVSAKVQTEQLLDVSKLHQLGGSPSKFDNSRTKISVDETYRVEMDKGDRKVVDQIAGDYWRSLCRRNGVDSD